MQNIDRVSKAAYKNVWITKKKTYRAQELEYFILEHLQFSEKVTNQ